MGKSPAKGLVPRKNGAKPAPPAARPVIPRAKRQRPGETKRERFMRIGEYRMGQALHAIKLLKPLSGIDYEWNERDASLMVSALRQAVDEIADAFVPRPATKQKEEEKFSFIPERRH